ncbi:polysaccharide biosynthesis tyrosine autokinase [Paenibacillus albiflavus]|uniref:non-specific protein-tyrosine kinase n=1 Tax=Paenibacillus albiflavus TaxID=2545760 RepID=A0A4R4EH63_9BACL|nr:CpsD/CapB family tyrosine-protein kinase [Paenibacillus albiflavus]TCZ77508.1 polysaccharide biosynthesis tyrosine autokinase [Paenibacillus albiflavus]
MLRQINRQAMIASINPRSPVSETFRMLRTNLQFLINDDGLKVISVISANPGEGKSTTLVNLAITFADEGKRVLLIDGDLRRSSLHQIFQLRNEMGLSNYLGRKSDIQNIIHQTYIHNLDVITSGPVTYNPSELLGSAKFIQLIEQLKEQYDLVLFDSPPLIVADSKIIASKADGVIIVVKSGKTRRDDVLKLKNQLEGVNVNVLGVVLNNHKPQKMNGYHHYY